MPRYGGFNEAGALTPRKVAGQRLGVFELLLASMRPGR